MKRRKMLVNLKRKTLNQLGNIRFIIVSIFAIILVTLLVLGLISYAKNGIEVTTLSIVTKSSDNKFSLSGAKYIIKKITTDENNNEVIEDAKDYYGNLIGNEENIDGTAYRIITSNENGEINLDLPSGKYRITEIVAPTGYKLNENNSYDIVLDKKGNYSLFYTNKEWEKEFKEDETRLNPLDIKETTGEEYIALVEVVARYTVPAQDKEDNQPSELKPGLYIFRYNANNKIKEIVYLYENAQRNIETNIKILNETEKYYILYLNEEILAFEKDGELVNDFCSFIYDLDMYFLDNYYVSKQTGDITIVGQAYGENTIPAEQTSGNKEITFGEEDLESNILIQINSEGKVNWLIDFKDAEIISNIMQRDSNVTINISVDNDIILNQGDDDIELSPGAYNLTIKNGQVENAVNLIDSFKNQLYSDNDLMEEHITADFGTLSFIYVYDKYTIQPENTVNNELIQLNSYQMYVIKLNSEDKVEWATPINLLNDNIIYYTEVSNGYIINATMSGTINAEYVLDGNDIELGSENFATIKFDKTGKVMHVEQEPIENNTEEVYCLDNLIELENRKFIQLKTKDSLHIPESIVEGREIEYFHDTKLEKYVEIEEKREKIDKQILTVTNGKEDSLQIIKQDSRTAELLPGSKFTIKKVITNADGTVTKENALNNDGELVGNIENINGEDIRVVTTNENGEINESLPVGKYEIVEVKAPEGYYLKPTVEENTYEVEISEKQAEKKEWKESWSRIVGEYKVRESSLDEYEAVGYTKILQKDETGVIVYLANNEHLNIPAEDTVNNVEINLYNPVIIKYNLDNKVEWIKSTIEFEDIKKTENNEYIVNGYLEDEIEIPAEDTANNEELVIPRGSVTLKYDSEFKIMAVGMNSPSSVLESEYIICEYNSSEKEIPAEDTVNNQAIILQKGDSLIIYNKQMKVERVLTGYYNIYSFDDLGEIAFEVEPKNTTIIDAKDTVNNKEIVLQEDNRYIVIIDENTLKIENVIYIPYSGDYTKLNEGYLMKGYFIENQVIPAEYTADGKDIEIENPYEDYIVKYNNEGKIQLVLEGELRKVDKNDDGYTLLLENSSGYTNLVNIDNNWNILNIIEDFVLNTSDGGYIKYENYLTNTTITKEINTTGNDIFIEKGLYLVKMNSENKIEWLLKQDKIIFELAEINEDNYFGAFGKKNSYYGLNLGFLQISQETIQEQLSNKVVLNVTNESDVGKVVVKYVDRETNQEIASSEEFEDRVGVAYETEAKNIQYYKLEGTPENSTGTVASGTTEVIYYYDKQDFNIKTDKTISELYVNGEKQNIKNNKNNIFQVSVHRKEIENTELKIKYIIKIENTGEIPGTAGIVTDQIPEGLEFYEEDNAEYWQLKDGIAITDKLDGELIEPGEYKELEIVLRCTNLGDKVGLQTNKAVAENMKNNPNFEDSNSKDDLGECELLISVGLGGQDIVKILLISIVALVVVAKVINKFRRKSK